MYEFYQIIRLIFQWVNIGLYRVIIMPDLQQTQWLKKFYLNEILKLFYQIWFEKKLQVRQHAARNNA